MGKVASWFYAERDNLRQAVDARERPSVREQKAWKAEDE